MAVAAQKAGKEVLILDLDPQQTAKTWWEEREADSPQLVAVSTLKDIDKALTLAGKGGFDLLIFDTPGREANIVNKAIALADLCLIPSKPNKADILAHWPYVEAIRKLDKPGAFVLSMCKSLGRTRLDNARAALGTYGLPIAPLPIADRYDFPDAFNLGLGVLEYDPASRAADEIKALWTYTEKRLAKLETETPQPKAIAS